MSIMKTDSANYSAIANAIRAKGVEGSWKPAEMPSAIAAISGGGGSGENYTDFIDTEELYLQLRPKEWPQMPSAKQYLLEHEDVWFCGYYFYHKNVGASLQPNFFFQAVGIATMTAIRWTGTEWEETGSVTNTKAGTSTSNYNYPPSIDNNDEYVMVRVTSTDTNYPVPFASTTSSYIYSQPSELVDVDFCGRAGTSTAYQIGNNIFGAAYFINVESLGESNFNTPPILFTIGAIAIPAGARLRLIRNYHVMATSYVIASGAYALLAIGNPLDPTYNIYTSHDLAQNGAMSLHSAGKSYQIPSSATSSSSIRILGSYENGVPSSMCLVIHGMATGDTKFGYLANDTATSLNCRKFVLKYKSIIKGDISRCYNLHTSYFGNIQYCNKPILFGLLDFCMDTEQVDFDKCASHNITISYYCDEWDEETETKIQLANAAGWTITISTGGPIS